MFSAASLAVARKEVERARARIRERASTEPKPASPMVTTLETVATAGAFGATDGARGSDGSASALVALFASLAALAAELRLDPSGFAGASILANSLFAGSAGLAAGALAALAFPTREGRRYLPPADPFVDLPFDPANLG